jgi:uncharacterized protein YerC
MNKRLVWDTKGVQEVMELLAETKEVSQVELIFDRILTTREINDIGRRYRVLRMLEKNHSYRDIMLETGMSTSAIARLSAKCGFGFRKSSKLAKPKKARYLKRKARLHYKGVRVR